MIHLVVALAIWFNFHSAPPPSPPSFKRTVQPILEKRCQPCHFPGGKMYERLPFDRPETITKLGTKLFTRIKDGKEREVIRTFLAHVIPSREDGEESGRGFSSVSPPPRFLPLYGGRNDEGAVALWYHSVLHWSHCLDAPRGSNTLNNSAHEFIRDCSLFTSTRVARRNRHDV